MLTTVYGREFIQVQNGFFLLHIGTLYIYRRMMPVFLPTDIMHGILLCAVSGFSCGLAKNGHSEVNTTNRNLLRSCE